MDIAQVLKDRGYTLVSEPTFGEGVWFENPAPEVVASYQRGNRAYAFGKDGGVRRFSKGSQTPYSHKEDAADGNYRQKPHLFEWQYPAEFFRASSPGAEE